ncbi:MAG: CHAP domain-containing protein [Lachnospiraceae bacterium]|nr:CHAP domain-containing protein [Lachnospiraceae bacterium]
MKRQINRMIIVAVAIVIIVTGMFGIKEVSAASNPYPGSQNVDGDQYYEIPCTWFVWQHVYNNLGIELPKWGNGGQWLDNARNSGWSTGNEARINSIAVWQDGGFGHVAFVSAVNGDTMEVSEGGRTDLDHTASHGITYNFKVSSNVGSYRSEGRQRLAGFIYLPGFLPPQGCVDSIKGGKGNISVSGWAFDKDVIDKSLQIHIYIGGPAGTQGAEKQVIMADAERKDVNDAYNGVGNHHGFSATLNTSKYGRQPVYIYAINEGADIGSPCIGSGIVDIAQAYNPEGSYDSATGGKNCVRVTGWAFDRDSTGTALKMHIYIGGAAGEKGAECHEITANLLRKDVNNVHKAGDYHGFDATIKTNKVGVQPVYVYAINIGGGQNLCLGNKSVTISGDIKLEKISNVVVKSLKTKTADMYWPSVEGVDGYEIAWAANPLFFNKKTAKQKENQVKISGLTRGRKYYFKVRAYKVSGNKTYYGQWSNAVSCNIK